MRHEMGSKCRAIRPLIAEVVDADADQRVVRLVELHALECDACRAELDRMRCALGMLADLEPVEPSADFEDRVMARVRAHQLGAWSWSDMTDRIIEALALRPFRTAALTGGLGVLAGVALGVAPAGLLPASGTPPPPPLAAESALPAARPAPLPAAPIPPAPDPELQIAELTDSESDPDSLPTDQADELEQALSVLEARLAAESGAPPIATDPRSAPHAADAGIVPAALDARDRAVILETDRRRRSF